MSCKLQIKIAIDSEVVLKYFLHSDPLKQLSQSGTKQPKSSLYQVQGDNAFPVSLHGLWTFNRDLFLWEEMGGKMGSGWVSMRWHRVCLACVCGRGDLGMFWGELLLFCKINIKQPL